MAACVQDTVAEMAADLSRRKGATEDADALHAFINKVSC